MAKRNFGKEYKTPQELVSLLEARGLIINDCQKAQLYLQSIGYYRLSAYMHPFLREPKSMHQYKEGASFKKVMMLYRFDKKLRLFLFNEIEKIEIAVREAVMNMTAERTGDIYWLTNSSFFHNQAIFHNSMTMLSKEYERSTEDFIEHIYRNLSSCVDSWRTSSHGQCQHVLPKLKRQDSQKANCKALSSTRPRFRILAFRAHAHTQCMLPSCTCLE